MSEDLTKKMDLIKINPAIINKKIVGYYFLYKINVPRGIRKKGKPKEEELLIHGVPIKQLEKYYLDHKEQIDKIIKE